MSDESSATAASNEGVGGTSSLILGHRGAPGEQLENTLRSLQKALELGADGVECDVRRTADGRIVLFHDRDLKRLAGAYGSVEEASYDRLRSIPLPGDERMPSLEEVLDAWPDHAWLNLEFKTEGPEIVSTVVSILNQRPRTFLSSFRRDHVAWCEREGWKGERWLIVGRHSNPHDFVDGGREIGCRGVVVDARFCVPFLVERYLESGLSVGSFGARDAEHERGVAALGVQRIITDEPRSRL